MEATTHCQRAEIVAKKRSSFKPHRCLAAPNLFLDTMLNRSTCEACLIDYIEAMSNIYRNGSQTCCPKGKTYRDAHLGELVHFVAVEHASEHKVIWGSKPTREKCGEGEITADQQPPRASGCEAATPSRG
jgi:hypothetical protein